MHLYFGSRLQGLTGVTRFAFGVAGDIHVAPGSSVAVFSPSQWQTVVSTWRDRGYLFGVVVGDLGYGALADIDAVIAGVSQTAAAPPVFFSMGNHELDAPAGKRAWIDALYPSAVQASSWTPTVALPGNSDRAYWSFNVGASSHFVFLDADAVAPDSGRNVGQRLGAAQLAWLASDLQVHQDRNLFVFVHEPVEQARYDTPFYTLYDRAALLEILARHPRQKFVFSGHLHGYRGRTSWKGISFIHVSEGEPSTAGVRVDVDGFDVNITWPSMTAPVDYDKHPMYDVQLSGTSSILRVAEEGGDYGRTRVKPMLVVGAENGVKPTSGSLMLKAGPLTWYDQYFISEQLIRILPGMRLSYDIYLANVQPGMDAVSVQPGWSMLDGVPPPAVADQNGIPLSARPRDGSTSLYYEDLPSLGGRATGTWYHREFDLTPWAGHYIDGFLLGSRAQRVNIGAVYVDNIQLQWPTGSQTTCTYSVDPIAASFGPAGGTGSVSVGTTAGCGWIASSNASWVSVTGGSPGSGPGTVSYAVALNPYTAQRVGTLTVAGTTVTTTQLGDSGTSATFVATDTTTQGTWRGAYGSQAYVVVSDSQSLPGHVIITPSGQSTLTWAASTADVRALQKPAASDRIAAAWYSRSSFKITVNVADGLTHRLAVYVLDWDSAERSQTIDVLDAASGLRLDSRAVAGFRGGHYLIWEVRGKVTLRVKRTRGANAVVSGIFVDPE